MEDLGMIVAGFVRAVNDAAAHHSRPRGGTQLPYPDDFGQVNPSTLRQLKWWAGRMASASACPSITQVIRLRSMAHDLAVACGWKENLDGEMIVVGWEQLLAEVRRIRRERDALRDELCLLNKGCL